LNELKLSIENINPAVLWGPNNDHFEIIKKQYPKLKIVARGSEVKILGDEQRTRHIFQEKFDHLIQHVEKFENLNITMLNAYLAQGYRYTYRRRGTPDKFASSEVIVFGPNGIMVKARTPTSAAWWIVLSKSDILFAIGPAGTGKTYTAVALAVRALKNKEIKRIILNPPGG
jgi:phosphate starvation-inducible PhoH-like protein